MQINEIIKKIKTYLSEIKLSDVITTDGIVLTFEGEELAVGIMVSIVNETETAPAPAGEYVLEDGRTLVVDETGTITEIIPAEAPVEDEPESEVPVDAPDEDETSEVRMTKLEKENKELYVMLASMAKTISKLELEKDIKVNMKKEISTKKRYNVGNNNSAVGNILKNMYK